MGRFFEVFDPPGGCVIFVPFSARQGRRAGGADQAGKFPLEMPQIPATQYAGAQKRRMTTNMAKTKQKTPRPLHYPHTVEPRKTPKMAGNTRAGNPAKGPKKRRSPKLPVCLTIPEKDRFFKAIKSPRDLHTIFGLMYFHGAAGE